MTGRCAAGRLAVLLGLGAAGCLFYQPLEPSLLWHSFEATAYCDRGFTSSGVWTRQGIVAGDPRVLPQGSVIDIKYEDTTLHEYGVMDRGSAVKGYRIDIWMESCAAALAFGRRPVRVRVRKLGEGR